ncbi:MAG TPA: glutamate-cysteine ligase family protein [Spirochaetota bacterium]|nr:glutamate-cysteine ligase family protein [Spirochaetota bacterium]HPJ34513.1 glutamate-cysteine ligase family protein [Spirochaetota bacterium]
MNDPLHAADTIYNLGLFEATGIELEYMITDSDTLDVMPICDKILFDISGSIDNEVYPDGEDGFSAWSNELALHVLEFKSLNPVRDIKGAGHLFRREINTANRLLEKYNAKLLPSAMHPWMIPDAEFKIWPYGNREIYEAFDRIFGCKGHGWSNLQSLHINLPFKNNEEFRKLHTAIRILLPVINALTASSPFVEGKFSGFHDYRLEIYRTNSIKIPSITGYIIPEPVQGIEEYNTEILDRIYQDLENFDPTGILKEEWINARGCIARFDRGAIEIRTSDIQECPEADIACASLIIEVLKKLVYEEISSIDEQLSHETYPLYKILLSVARNGDTVIDDPDYLHVFGLKKPCSALNFWEQMASLFFPDAGPEAPYLSNIFKHGNLSRRILNATGLSPSRDTLKSIYKKLSASLATGEQFLS